MKLRELIASLPYPAELIVGDDRMDTDITALCTDSRKVGPGALFFCIPGTKVDGHTFAQKAMESGAAALVVQRGLELDIPQVLVGDARSALGYMASAFAGHPSRGMKLIGLTGTKGKTTTSYLIKSALEAAGEKVGLIGTVCCMIGDEILPAGLTTPDPLVLEALLSKMREARCGYVVMEVSAHAIDMHRLDGLHFAAAAFTNFSQDHLDYFGTMKNYFDAKLRFFTEGMTDAAAYNADDAEVAKGFERAGIEALRVGIRSNADLYAKDIEIGERGSNFKLTCHKRFTVPVSLRLSGIFNVYNALTAAALCTLCGVAPEAISAGLNAVRAVPGRVELLDTNTPYRMILDYAHSPDSLENILKSLRETTKGRLIALFGCGGNRDAQKRPIMGRIGGELADFCVLTSDNPRYEDPNEILLEVETGTKETGCPYIVIENRREAILWAMKHAQPGDCVVLAGKGHETYQEIKGVKYPFDEKVVVAELLKEMKE